MGEPQSQQAFVVVPVDTADAATSLDRSPDQTAKIAKAIENSLHEQRHEAPPAAGPLKEMIGMANSDSLYRYINWEKPARTLRSFVIALSILVGAHYIPLTSWILKCTATVFGVVSVTEGINRVFSSNTILGRLRPMEYKTIPESTLNATLHDIHDLLQVAVVQAQRMLYGEDLGAAFLAFIGTTVVYELLKVASPFGIAVSILIAIYLAPLAVSPQGREAANDVKRRTTKLVNATTNQTKALTQDGKVKASELTTKAQESAAQASGKMGDVATSLGGNTRNLAQDGQRTVQDMANQAVETTSNLSGAAAENVKKLPEASTNAVNGATGTVREYVGSLLPGVSSKVSQTTSGVQEMSGTAQSKPSDVLRKKSDDKGNTAAYASTGGYRLAPGTQNSSSQTGKGAPQVPHSTIIATPRSVGDHPGSGITTMPIVN